MDANKFTRRSQEAIGAAIELASSGGNPSVEPVHLLSALLAQPDGIAGALCAWLIHWAVSLVERRHRAKQVGRAGGEPRLVDSVQPSPGLL